MHLPENLCKNWFRFRCETCLKRYAYDNGKVVELNESLPHMKRSTAEAQTGNAMAKRSFSTWTAGLRMQIIPLVRRALAFLRSHKFIVGSAVLVIGIGLLSDIDNKSALDKDKIKEVERLKYEMVQKYGVDSVEVIAYALYGAKASLKSFEPIYENLVDDADANNIDADKKLQRIKNAGYYLREINWIDGSEKWVLVHMFTGRHGFIAPVIGEDSISYPSWLPEGDAEYILDYVSSRIVLKWSVTMLKKTMDKLKDEIANLEKRLEAKGLSDEEMKRRIIAFDEWRFSRGKLTRRKLAKDILESVGICNDD